MAELKKISGGGPFEMSSILKVEDIPLWKADSGILPCFDGVIEILERKRVRYVSLEWPSSRPDKHRNQESEYRFGLGCGIILAAAHAAADDVVLYAPSAWKVALGVTSDKRSSFEMAKRIAGDCGSHDIVDRLTGPRGGVKDGRCEAILMVEHFRRSVNAGKRLITVA